MVDDKLPHPAARHSCGYNVIPSEFRFSVGANKLHKPRPHGNDNRPYNILQAISQNADNRYGDNERGESNEHLTDSRHNAVKYPADTLLLHRCP